MSMTISGTQIAFPDASTQNTAATGFGFKNRIINGAFQIAQRGTSFASLPIASATNNTYTLDRWAFAVANSGDSGAITVSQVSNGGIRFATATANGSISTIAAAGMRQIIEGFNCYDLAGLQATVSFTVKTNKAGNYGIFLYDYTGAAYGTPQSITCAGTGAAETFTKTFTMPATIPANNTGCVGLNITLLAGTVRAGTWYPTGGSQVNLADSTSNYFEIYNLQLEKGSTATSFDYRPYGTELALCQRYYYMLVSGANYSFANGCALSSSQVRAHIPLPVPMRTSASLVQTTGANYYSFDARTGVGVSSFTPIYATTTGVLIYNGGASATAGDGGTWLTNNASAYLAFSAEL